MRRFFNWIKRIFSSSSEPTVDPPAKPPRCDIDKECDDNRPDSDNGKPSTWVPEKYRTEYVELWETMKYPVLRSGSNGKQLASTLNWSVNFVNRGKSRYIAASNLILERLAKYVPWQVIGCLHLREAGGYVGNPFNRNLMNGQPLNMETTIVPRGYGPWNSFEESAVDALRIKDVPDVWTIANTLYFCERYNGMGYRMNDRENVVGYSPYLWSMTNHYIIGYFVADHTFSRTAVAKGAGLAPILRELGYAGYKV